MAAKKKTVKTKTVKRKTVKKVKGHNRGKTQKGPARKKMTRRGPVRVITRKALDIQQQEDEDYKIEQVRREKGEGESVYKIQSPDEEMQKTTSAPDRRQTDLLHVRNPNKDRLSTFSERKGVPGPEDGHRIKVHDPEHPHHEVQAKLTALKMVPMRYEAVGAHANDCLIIIMGVTGDLAKKRLLPAIYKLLKDQELANFAILGVARSDTNAKTVLDDTIPFINDPDKKLIAELHQRFYYHKANFYHDDEIADMKVAIDEIEKDHGLSGNRLFYLATIPKHFDVIISHLENHKMAHHQTAWNRVVFEKPFGEDLKTARVINSHIRKVFKEEQIYRVDHYLDKELVQNIITSRFTNTVLEPIWNRKFIDHVQIILSEDFGIEERGAYYDAYGALKDVVQNHLLQLVSLTAMEPPKSLKADHIRDAKVKLLKRIKPLHRKEAVLGQYEGYTQESGVAEDSKTETFAAMKLFIRNRRWRKVPFYLFTGKNLRDKMALIYVQFKNIPCSAYKDLCEYAPNHLIIQIQPNEGMYLQLNAKEPGKTGVRPIDMEFCYSCTYGPNTPEAYANLLMQVIHGDQSVFVRSDEIVHEWAVIEKIIEQKPSLVRYVPGQFPKEADELIRKDGRHWHLRLKGDIGDNPESKGQKGK